MRYFLAGFLGTIGVMLVFVMTVYLSPLRGYVNLWIVRLTDAKFEQLGTCHDAYLLGDSSGNGLDFEYISRKMHKDVITVALTGFAGREAYDTVLTHIAKEHCPSPLIVIYLAARDILYDTGTDGSLDGFYISTAFGGVTAGLEYFLRHPLTLPRTALTTLNNLSITKHDFRKIEYFNTAKRSDIEEHLSNDCHIEHIVDAIEPERFLKYKERTREEFPHLTFLFVAAPAPACTSNRTVIDQVDVLTDHGIDYMPNTYFRDYTHLSVLGVKPVSDRLITILSKKH